MESSRNKLIMAQPTVALGIRNIRQRHQWTHKFRRFGNYNVSQLNDLPDVRSDHWAVVCAELHPNHVSCICTCIQYCLVGG
jgi:hypothetical protein